MKELNEILDKHRKWLNGEEGGERADLSCADLSGADLSCADLSGADLSSADLSRADLSCANLSCANLSCADLSGADLSCADLSCADLSCADLSGANLYHANGNRVEIKTLLFANEYPITYTNEVLQIGCERHSISEWVEFDDKRILEMDGKAALNFWRKYKDFIFQAIELSPAHPTGKEGEK